MSTNEPTAAPEAVAAQYHRLLNDKPEGQRPQRMREVQQGIELPVRQKQRYLGQFTIGRQFTLKREGKKLPRERRDQIVTVVRSPRPDVKAPTLRIQFEDGQQATVRPSALARLPIDTHRDAPAAQSSAPPGRAGAPLEYPPTPLAPDTRTRLDRITHEARAEINLLAQSIHRRYFIPDLPGLRVGAQPAQPKRDERATLYRESYHGAYSDAMEACRQLNAGNVDSAEWYAQQALAHRANLKRATKALEAGSLAQSTGRYFHGELLSVRQYQQCDDPKLKPAFTQWYVRLVFTWSEDGVTLLVANGAQLEGETGVEVGPDGWADLCGWVQAMTDIRDGKRQGRRVSDDRELVYAWQKDDERYRLRRSIHREYPHLLRAMECLRRALHLDVDLQPGELPDDRPLPGYHEARPWDDVERDDTVDDLELEGADA